MAKASRLLVCLNIFNKEYEKISVRYLNTGKHFYNFKSSHANLQLFNNSKINKNHYSTINANQIKNSFKWLADKIGTDLKEVRLNFNYFRQNAQNIPFAIIQLNNDAIKNQELMLQLGESISFLHHNDMRILITLGQQEPNDVKIDAKFLMEKKAIYEKLTIDLMNSFSKFNLVSMPIFNGNRVFKCENSNKENLFGNITNLDLELIDYCFKTQQIPIINSIGECSNSNQYLYLNINHVTFALAVKLKPFKLINLNFTGGIRDKNHKLLLNVNIPNNLITQENFENISFEHTNSSLDDIKKVLKAMPSYSSYVITSVKDMVAELFTNKGRGTYFKISESIICTNNLNELNLDKLKNLIEASFDKKLKEDYFEKLKHRNPIIFVTESFSALAIITRDLPNYAYLDKFCVASQNQGHGLSDLLWDYIQKDFKNLFWRSRITNPINSWYFRRAQGSWQTQKWILFWYGLEEPCMSSNIINYATNLDSSFHEDLSVNIKN